MRYQRIEYTTKLGTQGFAYWDSSTGEAWDVTTRLAIAIMQDATTNLFTEWEPKKAVDHVANKTNTPRNKRSTVTLRPMISSLMIIPTGLFALGVIWLEWEFQR